MRKERERKDEAAIAAAMQQGYAVLDSVTSMVELRWERTCAANSWVCIVVRRYVTRAELWVHFGKKRLTPAGLKLLKEMVDRRQLFCNWGPAHLKLYDRVPVDVAKGVAAELWGILSVPENIQAYEGARK